jgi:N-acetylneuraminate lyase
MKDLRGIYPALPTPMAADGRVDLAALKALTDFVIGQGVDGLYVGGSTAESFLLTEDERFSIAETVLTRAAGRVKVIVHTGAGGTDAAVRLSKHARANGADAISSVPPIYFKYTTDEVIAYYLDLIEQSEMPLVVYNIPAFTGINMTQGPIAELFKHPRVVALKHTNTNMYELERVLAHNPALVALNGYDEAFLSGLAMGAHGMIGSTVNFMARKFIALRDAFVAGRNAEAFRLQREANAIIETLVEVGVFSAVKYALTLRGVDCGACRGPFRPLTEEGKARVRAVLEAHLGEELQP